VLPSFYVPLSLGQIAYEKRYTAPMYGAHVRVTVFLCFI